MPKDDRPPEPPQGPPEEQDEGRFRVLDVRFWLAIAFLVLCLIVAAVVGWFGSQIWPPKAPPNPAPAASSAAAR